MEWRIGCSGYHYAEWKRVFYPDDIPQRKWFEYYAQHFNTLELNATYYKFPRAGILKSWYSRSPKGFVFSVKAPRHITHFSKFNKVQRMLADFGNAVREGLGEKLGCILFQFPANFHFEPERLNRITDLLHGSVRNVLEFRHESWWTEEVYAALTQSGITFSGMSHPSLPDEVIRTTDTLYYRFHGVPHLYTSPYEGEKLEKTVHEMSSHRPFEEAFVYFNNTAEGHAVSNARQLQEICEPVH